jgi:GTPase SAR1 family protein
MIIVLFGQPHSGKSTLAKMLPDFHNIDGDKLRDLFQNKDFSREGRIKNLNRASDIAHYLNGNGTNVVLSLVYPYKEARDYLNSLTTDVKWIYLVYEVDRGREKFHVQDFEYPDQEQTLYLNTEWMTEEECINEIKHYAKLSS